MMGVRVKRKGGSGGEVSDMAREGRDAGVYASPITSVATTGSMFADCHCNQGQVAAVVMVVVGGSRARG